MPVCQTSSGRATIAHTEKGGSVVKKYAGLVGFVLLGSCLTVPASAGEECGAVTNVQGAAQIIRNGQAITVAPDTKLQKGDLIRAPKGSSVDFSMNGVAGLRAADGAECEIASADPEDMRIDLALGELTANLKKLKGKSTFKVETPTAIATVRGTQFMSRVTMNLQGLPDASFAVRDSIVDVTAKKSGQTFSVQQGQAIDIPSQPKGGFGVRQAAGNEIVKMEDSSRITACG